LDSFVFVLQLHLVKLALGLHALFEALTQSFGNLISRVMIDNPVTNPWGGTLFQLNEGCFCVFVGMLSQRI